MPIASLLATGLEDTQAKSITVKMAPVDASILDDCSVGSNERLRVTVALRDDPKPQNSKLESLKS